MLYYVRTVMIQEGKRPEAIAWAKKAASYVNNNYSDVRLQALQNLSGLEAQIHFVYSYESFAARETFHETLQADSGWQDLMAENKGQDLIIRNSIVRNFYETIE